MAHILVVASSSALASSLSFALEAEGHRVEVRPNLAAISDDPAQFACTVLDHHAAGLSRLDAAAFLQRFHPVVLLANEDSHLLSPFGFRTVTKPHLGPLLLRAVEEAVAVSGR